MFKAVCKWLARKISRGTHAKLMDLLDTHGTFIHFFFRLINEKIDGVKWRCVTCGVPFKINDHCAVTRKMFLDGTL